MMHRRSWLLVALFAACAILQFTLATRQCLWGDELFSVALATGHSLEQPAAAANATAGDFVEPARPVRPEELQRYLKQEQPPASPPRVVRAVFLSDTSPPLYYLLLYGWTFFLGASDLVVRSFSVVCSLACFPLLASVARRIGGEKAVVPACLLFAISPLGLYFSTEVRMYSLLLFCVLAAAWASLLLQQEGGSAGRHLLWITVSAAGFLTHYFFLFPWLAMVAFLLLEPGRFERRWLFGCIAIVTLLILPWYIHVPDSLGRWRVTGGWLHMRPRQYNSMRATRNHFVQFFSAGGSGLWPYAAWPARTALFLFAVIFGAMALRLRSGMFRNQRLLVWLWFIAACLAPSVLDRLQHTYLTNNPRYALAALPAAYLLAALGLASMPGMLRLTMALLVALVWIPPLANIYHQHWRNSQPLCEVAQQLQYEVTASDLVLVHSVPSGVLGVARYTRAPLEMTSWVQQLGTRTTDSLRSLISGRKRIVLVRLHLLGEPSPEEEWLRANADVASQKRIEEIRWIEFRPRDADKF